MSVGGAEHLLAHGEATAVVTEVGGGLRALLAPWPNGVAGGRYRFGGREHQLPLTEPERRNALHSLVCWERFEVRRVDRATVVATHAPAPRPGYPFRLVVTATYALGEAGPAGLRERAQRR